MAHLFQCTGELVARWPLARTRRQLANSATSSAHPTPLSASCASPAGHGRGPSTTTVSGSERRKLLVRSSSSVNNTSMSVTKIAAANV
ncbi:hypothetical protein N658DRAFT_286024 [Parathielavia hyrcaniae]|uniref:Uncharacterized protein n=1 Tax=Parathielavia hyrcaniae TaxID=113614 RepID=A0AAN6Q542_9PEZI|nr:hypothetical protein N658DRAFT_286024 [Parathielavia hyrcaniae]